MLVKVERGIETSRGVGGDSVVVGDSDLVALEKTEEGEDVVVGGVGDGSIDCSKGSAAVLGLETHRESLISNNTGEGSLSSLIVQHVHGSIEGKVVVLVLTIELDGVQFFGVNLHHALDPCYENEEEGHLMVHIRLW